MGCLGCGLWLHDLGQGEAPIASCKLRWQTPFEIQIVKWKQCRTRALDALLVAKDPGRVKTLATWCKVGCL